MLFLVADKVYRVNSSLEVIADAAWKASLDLQTNELTINTSNEILFYNFLANKSQLLTRSTTAVNFAMVRSSLGYGFVANQNGLEIIEIDTRDRQNRYQLFSGKFVSRIALTTNQKTIVVLVNGSLVSLEIRN